MAVADARMWFGSDRWTVDTKPEVNTAANTHGGASRQAAVGAVVGKLWGAA
eukprot:NODE_14974_length_1075_cov_4.187764.p8 GENE.NODE_14974_length_1075_cov_4.187764~~NODE_14974_length_1075_cov_4.187764.p8  ORF type:complete len:51 (-),score=5.17 NODE_14974_length_1075_cov_4.187764:686-838(-)